MPLYMVQGVQKGVHFHSYRVIVSILCMEDFNLAA